MHSTTTTTFFIIVVSVAISTCYSQDDEKYTPCARNFSCGPNIQNVGYPFWGNSRLQDCGHPSFELKCPNNEYPTIEINNRDFRVLDINQSSHTITIASLDLWETHCTRELHNITLDHNLLRYGPMNWDLFIFYNCTSEVTTVFPYTFTCQTGGIQGRGFYTNESLYNRIENSELTCTQSLKVPMFWVIKDEILNGSLPLEEGLHRGFEVVYGADDIANCSRCEDSGGICGSDSSGFVCHCSGGTEHMTCQNRAGNKRDVKLKFAIAFGASVVSIGGIMIILLLCLCRKKLRQSESIFFWKTKTENYRNIEAFLKNCGSLSPKRYTYSDIKKITDSFKTKLGQGGFGCVYKGKLENGCLVAVKVLKGLKGNGDEFINEVATISRTSHVHIVTLLGFCFEGSHRALMYEFMPNGSLDKFIHDGGSMTNRKLGWEALYQIAFGIARGLEYLHRGCNTRILHFDIKPHNILLNDDFFPKISDFGLAKLCPQKESIISLLGARGTAGYIAPEVFSRNFGAVSHKSDVYSFGMMVLEMVGGRKNISVEVDHTSEIYFPHWIYKRLELDEGLGLHGILGDEAKESARKMIIVGLWCIQTDPSHRPSISRVLEMLEGSPKPLQIPPKPFLSSPSRAPVDSSATLMS